MASHRIGTIEAKVTEPPCGISKIFKKLRTVARATNITASANIFVEKCCLLLFNPFSLRQHYLDQVLRVDNSAVVLSAGSAQLPMHLIGYLRFFIFKDF
jgi:hypothetical protein